MTPSCAQAIANNKYIKKIYVALIDPDPRNNRKGIEILKNAGKIVVTSCLEEEVGKFLEPYLLTKPDSTFGREANEFCLS